MVRWKFLFLFILLMTLCSVDPSADDVEVTTPSSPWKMTEPAIVLVKNIGDRTLYYLCTGAVHLEQHVNNKIVNTWQVHGFEDCLFPNPIAPDSTKEFSISFNEGWLPGDSLLTSGLTQDFIYTFRVELYYDDKFEKFVSKEQCRTRKFNVEL